MGGLGIYPCVCVCGPYRQVHPIQLVRDMVSEYLRSAMARAEAAGGVPDQSLDALLGGRQQTNTMTQHVGLTGPHGRQAGGEGRATGL